MQSKMNRRVHDVYSKEGRIILKGSVLRGHSVLPNVKKPIVTSKTSQVQRWKLNLTSGRRFIFLFRAERRHETNGRLMENRRDDSPTIYRRAKGTSWQTLQKPTSESDLNGFCFREQPFPRALFRSSAASIGLERRGGSFCDVLEHKSH